MANTQDYNANFIQFDICLLQDAFKVSKKILSEDETDRARLQYILSYSLKRIADHFNGSPINIQAGYGGEGVEIAVQEIMERHGEEAEDEQESISRIDYWRMKAKTRMAQGDYMPYDFDLDNITHIQFWSAAQKAKVRLGSISNTVNQYTAAALYIEKWRKKSKGHDTYTRIGIDLVWSVLDGKLSFRQFAVICAINAKLGYSKGSGNSAAKCIGLDDIHAAAHGYRSKKLLDTSGADYRWSRDMIKRTAVEVCNVLNFFRRVTYKKRNTYYSRELTSELFLDTIENRVVAKAEKKSKAAQNTDLLERRVAARQAAAAANYKPQVLTLFTGESIYSIEYLTTKNSPDEVNTLLRAATEIDWQGTKYYCFSRMPREMVVRLLTETLEQRANGSTADTNELIDKLRTPTRRR